MILYTTILFGLFTILIIGSALNPLLERLNVKQTREMTMVRMDTDEVTGSQQRCFNRFKKMLNNFDTYDFRPHFTK